MGSPRIEAARGGAIPKPRIRFTGRTHFGPEQMNAPGRLFAFD
jgi:hypothetical protein